MRITLVDRRNHHLFQPLLYQVATAGLNPGDIATPIRRILRKQKNVEVLLAEVAVDRYSRSKTLALDGAARLRLPHRGHRRDALLLWARDGTPFAPGLKTIGDALEIRRRVLSAFEFAERETDPAQQKAWLTFVVVGAGPTGVELSGSLCEIAQHALARDFRRIDPTHAQVILLEGRPGCFLLTPASSRKRRENSWFAWASTCARGGR